MAGSVAVAVPDTAAAEAAAGVAPGECRTGGVDAMMRGTGATCPSAWHERPDKMLPQKARGLTTADA